MSLGHPVGHPQFGKFTPCNNAIHETERTERVAKLSGLRPEDLYKSLSDIQQTPKNRAMMQAAKDMIDDPYGWLYIWGGPGNAKSEVLIALANQLSKSTGKSVLYTKLSKIIDFMRDSFAAKTRQRKGDYFDLSYIERFQKLIDVEILAIDEMDKVKNNTEFANDFRFDFLDDRYRSGVAGDSITLFAGNENPATFPEAIFDRIGDGRFKIVENTEVSARLNMRRNPK